MDNNPFSENREVAMIPYHAFEKQSDKYMTIIKWLIIVIVILIVSFVGYVIYSTQYETVQWEQEAEASWNSEANVNGSGEMNVYAGESEAVHNRKTEESEGSEGNTD